MAPSVQIKLFGGYDLRIGQQPAPALPSKTRALLAYLAAHPGRPISRETIADLLWPGRGQAQALHSLRQALTDLRQRLAGQEIVVRVGRALTLDQAVETDIAALFGQGSGSLAATATYPGTLLQGFPAISPEFDDWLSLRRIQMENTLLDALARIGDAAAQAGQQSQAMKVAEQMFAIDNLREDIHRRLLRACAAAGRRGDGLRYYQQIVETLRRNLNVAPARDVRDMAEQLRQEITSPRDDVPIHPHAVRAWPASISPPILAILPFRQTGADPLEAYLTAGLVSDLIGQLSVFRDIGVISHRSILGMRPDATDARVASDMLGVRYILAGTIRRSGASIRLSAELTDATTGSVLWSDVNDSGAALSFEMQDRLVGRVVSTLAPHVSVDDLRRLRANRPRSPVVYDTIMRVRQHLDSQQPDHWRNARSLLQSLIAAEPDYAEGHALLAECLGMLVERGASADIDADLRGMERATNAALMRDPNNLRALMLSAQRLLLFRRDYAGARALLATAVELYPSAALAWLFSALVCIGNEEADRAVAYAQHALTLSPYDFQIGLFQAVLSAAHYNAGNHRQAAEWGLRALSQPHIPDGLHRIMAALPAAIADVIRAAMSASSRRDFAM